MPKPLLRLIAILLVPCLIADPSVAQLARPEVAPACRQAGAVTASGFQSHIPIPISQMYEQQAILARLRDFPWARHFGKKNVTADQMRAVSYVVESKKKAREEPNLERRRLLKQTPAALIAAGIKPDVLFALEQTVRAEIIAPYLRFAGEIGEMLPDLSNHTFQAENAVDRVGELPLPFVVLRFLKSTATQNPLPDETKLIASASRDIMKTFRAAVSRLGKRMDPDDPNWQETLDFMRLAIRNPAEFHIRYAMGSWLAAFRAFGGQVDMHEEIAKAIEAVRKGEDGESYSKRRQQELASAAYNAAEQPYRDRLLKIGHDFDPQLSRPRTFEDFSLFYQVPDLRKKFESKGDERPSFSADAEKNYRIQGAHIIKAVVEQTFRSLEQSGVPVEWSQDWREGFADKVDGGLELLEHSKFAGFFENAMTNYFSDPQPFINRFSVGIVRKSLRNAGIPEYILRELPDEYFLSKDQSFQALRQHLEELDEQSRIQIPDEPPFELVQEIEKWARISYVRVTVRTDRDGYPIEVAINNFMHPEHRVRWGEAWEQEVRARRWRFRHKDFNWSFLRANRLPRFVEYETLIPPGFSLDGIAFQLLHPSPSSWSPVGAPPRRLALPASSLFERFTLPKALPAAAPTAASTQGQGPSTQDDSLRPEALGLGNAAESASPEGKSHPTGVKEEGATKGSPNLKGDGEGPAAPEKKAQLIHIYHAVDFDLLPDILRFGFFAPQNHQTVSETPYQYWKHEPVLVFAVDPRMVHEGELTRSVSKKTLPEELKDLLQQRLARLGRGRLDDRLAIKARTLLDAERNGVLAGFPTAALDIPATLAWNKQLVQRHDLEKSAYEKLEKMLNKPAALPAGRQARPTVEPSDGSSQKKQKGLSWLAVILPVTGLLGTLAFAVPYFILHPQAWQSFIHALHAGHGSAISWTTLTAAVGLAFSGGKNDSKNGTAAQDQSVPVEIIVRAPEATSNLVRLLKRAPLEQIDRHLCRLAAHALGFPELQFTMVHDGRTYEFENIAYLFPHSSDRLIRYGIYLVYRLAQSKEQTAFPMHGSTEYYASSDEHLILNSKGNISNPFGENEIFTDPVTGEPFMKSNWVLQSLDYPELAKLASQQEEFPQILSHAKEATQVLFQVFFEQTNQAWQQARQSEMPDLWFLSVPAVLVALVGKGLTHHFAETYGLKWWGEGMGEVTFSPSLDALPPSGIRGLFDNIVHRVKTIFASGRRAPLSDVSASHPSSLLQRGPASLPAGRQARPTVEPSDGSSQQKQKGISWLAVILPVTGLLGTLAFAVPYFILHPQTWQSFTAVWLAGVLIGKIHSAYMKAQKPSVNISVLRAA